MTRSKTPFWRAFGIALACHAVTGFVVSLVYHGAAEAVMVVAGGLFLFGVLAWWFPRGAAVLLVVFSVVAGLSEVQIGIHHPWRFVLLPVDLTAALFATIAIKRAGEYLAAKARSEGPTP